MEKFNQSKKEMTMVQDSFKKFQNIKLTKQQKAF